tara:strand:- start:4721 stop:5524 length:804 start_codon:yes stop_codon:yes gene_type:complete
MSSQPDFRNILLRNCISIQQAPNSPSPPSPPKSPPNPPSIPYSQTTCSEYSFHEHSLSSIFVNVGVNVLRNYIGFLSDSISDNILMIDEPYSAYSYRNPNMDSQKLEILESRNENGLIIFSNNVHNYLETCCRYCNNLFRSCGGFQVVVNETLFYCNFVSNNQEILNFSFDESKNYRRTFSYLKVDPRTSPPSPPFPSPPFTEPIIITPWYITFLTPEVLIPSIIGTVILLIVFIYLFRECTSERAGAFTSVIETVFGRSKPQVIVT